MFIRLLSMGGTLLKGLSAFWNRYKLLIVITLVAGALYRAYSIGYDLGSTYERNKAVVAVLEATTKARTEEFQYYKKQLRFMTEKHNKELTLERENARIQATIDNKQLTKQPACKISKDDGAKPVLTNGYVELYNDAVRAANRATQEGDTGGITKTMPTAENGG
ncbi:hypothetical protein VVP001_050 [Vibrio phage VVP001]|uniref:Uncharacterized protein n=1 Tax=Vibrio phage VVP001 TaxID=2059877 RepID=A0A3S6R1K3_9CAUD|nr:hypothetical protein VVP001_050 [Vibrio phage VVP001]